MEAITNIEHKIILKWRLFEDDFTNLAREIALIVCDRLIEAGFDTEFIGFDGIRKRDGELRRSFSIKPILYLCKDSESMKRINGVSIEFNSNDRTVSVYLRFHYVNDDDQYQYLSNIEDILEC